MQFLIFCYLEGKYFYVYAVIMYKTSSSINKPMFQQIWQEAMINGLYCVCILTLCYLVYTLNIMDYPEKIIISHGT